MEEKIPQKKSVFLLVILTFITLGIYPYFWYINRSNELNNLKTGIKIKKTVPIICLFLFILVLALGFAINLLPKLYPDQFPTASSINQIPTYYLIIIIAYIILTLIILITIIITAFKIRKILNQTLINKGEKVKLSWFYTLIFNYLYLQYEINRIIDDKENNKRTAPLICFILLFILPILASLIIFIILIYFLKASMSNLSQLRPV